MILTAKFLKKQKLFYRFRFIKSNYFLTIEMIFIFLRLKSKNLNYIFLVDSVYFSFYECANICIPVSS